MLLSVSANYWRMLLWLMVTVPCVFGGGSIPSTAQIIPDDTLGAEASTVLSPNPVTQHIEGGATRGSNLFHSFQEFNVGDGQAVYFVPNDEAIANILTRMTGANASNIFGTLGVLNSGANLWVLNPNGIIFGADASLDINGSFYATTAEAIPLGDVGAFSAVAPASSPLLTVHPEVFFNSFLHESSGSIVNSADLMVDQEQSLVLLGGTLTSDGLLVAPGGLVEIAAVGDVDINGISTAAVGEGAVGGDISISSISGDIEASSLSSYAFSYASSVGRGGNIAIASESGNITATSFDSSSFSVLATADDGGTITISSVSGDIAAEDLRSYSVAFEGDQGRGGAISVASVSGYITADSLNAFSASEFGVAGSGGNISVVSESGNLMLEELRSNSRSFYGTAGNAGDINVASTSGDITTDTLAAVSISENGTAGNGGNISVRSEDGNIDVHRIDVDSLSTYGTTVNGGNILIASTSGDIEARNLDTVSVSGFGNAGNGGNISIISEDGDIAVRTLSTNSFSQLGNTGNGGDIFISATNGNLQGIPVGVVDSPTRFRAYSLSRGEGTTGQGGSVSLEGDTISDIAIFTLSLNDGDGNTGQGGSVVLDGSVISDAEIVTVSETETSGNVDIRSSDGSLVLDNLRLVTTGQVQIQDPTSGSTDLITLDLDNISQSGNTTITSPGDIVFNNVQIQSDANGDEPAGNITVTSPGQVIFSNSLLSSNANSDGNAGEIIVNADRLNLGNGASFFAETSGAGTGGDIVINATDSVFLGEGVQDFAPIISVEASGAGQPGNIAINTPNFVLSETARITATATATATNTERGGSITLSADQMDLAGTVGVFAETQGQAPGGILTLQPYQTNPGLDLTLAEGAQVSASTDGSGRGGSLLVKAPNTIEISGPGRLEVTTSGSGEAGDITVEADRVMLADGVMLSAATSGSGPGGDITFNVAERLEINDSTVASSTGPESTGRGGNINFTPDTTDIVLRNSHITVDSAGTNRGGDVTLTANGLALDNSEITATTASNDGGNLTLTLADILFLSDNSLISTEAGIEGAGGDGGNITIASNFVLAIADENNDIIANAFDGDGGAINIDAISILGLTERSGFTTAQLRGNTSSDVSASSQFGTSGSITFNEAIANPEQGLTTLADNFVDPNTLIANSCIARSRVPNQGSFTITGRSGLPLQPADTSSFRFVDSGVRSLPSDTTAAIAMSAEPGDTDRVMEPDGVYQLADGRLVLSHRCDDAELD